MTKGLNPNLQKLVLLYTIFFREGKGSKGRRRGSLSAKSRGGCSMLIRSHLFDRGHPLKAEPRLADWLDNRKRGVINKLKGITALEEMTDSFCERIVKDALIEPLVLHFDQMTRQTRTETIEGSSFPGDFFVERGRRYPKTVMRIFIPFSGNRKLLEYSPSRAGLRFPSGEVYGNKIQFDLIMWGYADDASRVKQELESNRRLLETCATNVSKEVKEFNEGLVPQIKAAFASKLDELTKQHAIFDGLGIPEEPEPAVMPSNPAAPKPKRGRARADQIIVNVETMLVQTLNQTNNNTGDVNNAIQGS
jgi:hypothetical protein